MDILRNKICNRHPERDEESGDPYQPVTGYGVYMGMKASAKRAYGSDSLEGNRLLFREPDGSHLILRTTSSRKCRTSSQTFLKREPKHAC
ncbi:hypothetical protein [Rhodohalobacter sp.]|uniref:hypothetical protein n=1 Tax=Rhodohalobacter sp. TaxID=1974210 RepID=UPI002ACEDEAA|nr:hypothetical protein [Rhodohalobacter sp.]